MFLFDTDAHGLLVLSNENILRHVQKYEGQVWLSSVAAEEFIVGRLNSINRARAPRTSLSLPRAHEDFVQGLEYTRLLPILPYSQEADAVYRTFPASVTRVGSQDCRIAAQAIAHNLTVITRNVRGFEAIGAPCADWSL